MTDDEIRSAQRVLIQETRDLVEASGGSSPRRGAALRGELAGRRVALVASGGNVTSEQLLDVLSDGKAPSRS